MNLSVSQKKVLVVLVIAAVAILGSLSIYKVFFTAASKDGKNMSASQDATTAPADAGENQLPSADPSTPVDNSQQPGALTNNGTDAVVQTENVQNVQNDVPVNVNGAGEQSVPVNDNGNPQTAGEGTTENVDNAQNAQNSVPVNDNEIVEKVEEIVENIVEEIANPVNDNTDSANEPSETEVDITAAAVAPQADAEAEGEKENLNGVESEEKESAVNAEVAAVVDQQSNVIEEAEFAIVSGASEQADEDNSASEQQQVIIIPSPEAGNDAIVLTESAEQQTTESTATADAVVEQEAQADEVDASKSSKTDEPVVIACGESEVAEQSKTSASADIKPNPDPGQNKNSKKKNKRKKNKRKKNNTQN